MKTKKLYVVGSQKNYANFVDSFILVDNIKDADVVIFTGGEDVDPSLYGCKRHPSTFSNISRDLAEKAEFEKISPKQLVVGICRGSQFLCVMNGGKLIQNVYNHTLGHTHMITEIGTSKIYEITSTHHQMQYPFNLPIDQWQCLFATVGKNLSGRYEGDGIENVPYEPEIVLYHRENAPKCLAIQGHPEYMRHDSPIVIRINEIINSLLANKNEN